MQTTVKFKCWGLHVSGQHAYARNMYHQEVFFPPPGMVNVTDTVTGGRYMPASAPASPRTASHVEAYLSSGVIPIGYLVMSPSPPCLSGGIIQEEGSIHAHMRMQAYLGECAPVVGHDDGVPSVSIMVLVQVQAVLQQPVQGGCVCTPHGNR